MQDTMNGHLLENVNFEKDLGLIVDSELKFHIQTSSAIKKANKILGLIKKTFANLDANTLPLLYKSMVSPHLEYGNTAWGPHFKLGQQAIEKVQRRATKLVGSISNLTYKERLTSLNLPSFLYRRRRGDMIMAFKIINGKLGIKHSTFFKFNTAATRGYKQKLFKQRATKTVRSQSFSRRVINDWNGLSSEVVNAETVNEFKNNLDKFWQIQLYETPF